MIVLEPQKPTFAEKLHDVVAEEGKPLTVDVTAADAEKFEWNLNSKKLEDGKEGVHLDQEGDKGTLRLDELKKEHSGTLTVSAINQSGSQETSMAIEVKPAGVSPKVEAFEGAAIREHQDVVFKVKLLQVIKNNLL